MLLIKIMFEIVHIGYPKTASTWLQNEYFPKVKNFHFISWPTVNNSLLFTDCFLFDSQRVRDNFVTSGKSLLLSSEHLSTAINFGWHYGVYSFANAYKIKAIYPNAKIVIFVRRQQSLICSAYLQYIKNGGTFGFRKWLYSGKVFSFEHLIFSRLIQLYDSLFGEDNVKVYLFEEFKKNPLLFLSRFNEDLGFDIDLDEVSLEPVNRALRKRVAIIQKFMNLFYREPLGMKHYLIHLPGMGIIARQTMKRLNRFSVFGEFLSDENLLDPKDIDYIKTFYANSNKELSQRIGVDLKEYKYFIE
ncbi:hypothetical protein CYCD_10580 [Tenuifilaceae bacterium CYCD]|nr:hypothetical protein CYCD_10580 [Tenuifilaceae bacterium CYCD]